MNRIEELYSLRKRNIQLPNGETLDNSFSNDLENIQYLYNKYTGALEPKDEMHKGDLLQEAVKKLISDGQTYVAGKKNGEQQDISILRRTEHSCTLGDTSYRISLIVERGESCQNIAITAFSKHAVGFHDFNMPYKGNISYGYNDQSYSMFANRVFIFGLDKKGCQQNFSSRNLPGFDSNIRSCANTSLHVGVDDSSHELKSFLFFLGLEIAQRLGSKKYIVEDGQNSNDNFYGKFVRKVDIDSRGGWQFPLTSKATVGTQFLIQE